MFLWLHRPGIKKQQTLQKFNDIKFNTLYKLHSISQVCALFSMRTLPYGFYQFMPILADHVRDFRFWKMAGERFRQAGLGVCGCTPRHSPTMSCCEVTTCNLSIFRPDAARTSLTVAKLLQNIWKCHETGPQTRVQVHCIRTSFINFKSAL